RLEQRIGIAVVRELAALLVARDQTVIGLAGSVDDQMVRIRVADQKLGIHLAGFQQAVDQRENEQTVGARPYGYELIGYGGVAGTNGIDRDDLGAALLELAEAKLDGIRVVILRDTEEQEEARVLPVRLTKLPECAAHGVESGGRHVDRAEPAVRGIVHRAEAAGEAARQRL